MAATNIELQRLLERVEQILARFEATLPQVQSVPDWGTSLAYRWRKRGNAGFLQPVAHPHQIRLADLQGIDYQKKIDRAEYQAVSGRSHSKQRFADWGSWHWQVVDGKG